MSGVISLSEPAALSCERIEPTDATGAGFTNGSVDVTVSGGTAPYSYEWNTGVQSQDLIGVGAGTYSVTITDDNGCQTSCSATVNEPSAISCEVTAEAVSCYEGEDGGLEVTGSGGSGAYEYSLNETDYTTNNSFTGLSAGIYTIFVRDANETAAVSSCQVEIPEPSELLVEQTGRAISCNGLTDGEIDLTVSGGTAPYSYLWSTGSSAEDQAELSAGSYQVTVTDDNGCSVSGVISLSEPAALSCERIEPTDATGAGFTNGSVDVTVSGGTAPYSYEWNTGVQSQDLIGVGAGTYSVTITDDNGCQTSCSATVNEPSAISCEVTAEAVSCYEGEDGGLEVTGSGGSGVYEYSLNETDYTTNNSFTGLSAGIYTIFVRDANETAAVSSCQVEIPEPSELLVEQTGRAISCNGLTDGEIDLTVSGGTAPYSYLWSTGSSAEDQAELSAGSYQVTVTDDNGCSVSGVISLSEPAALSCERIEPTDATGAGFTNGSVDVTVSGGTAPYSYEWNTGVQSQDLIGVGAGTYSVTITDDNGCQTSCSATVNEPSGLQCSILVNDVICPGGIDGSLTLTAEGGSGFYEYSIDGQNFVAANVFDGLSAGNYTITVRDANEVLASSICTATIEEPSIAVAISAEEEICRGERIPILAIADGGVAGYVYEWDQGLGEGANQEVGPEENTTYTVTVTDANGCTTTGSVTIIVATPEISLSIDPPQLSVIEGQNASMTITVANNGNVPLQNILVEDISGDSGFSSTIPSLDPGNTELLSLVIPAVAENQTVNLVATAEALGGSGDVICQSNAEAALEILVERQIDLELDKSVNNLQPNVGEEIEFTLTLFNRGPSKATDIEVLEVLPSGFAFVGVAGDGTYDEVTGIWSLAELALNQEAILQITVVVLPGGDYTNEAEIIAVNENDADSEVGNGVDQDNDGDLTNDPDDEDDGDAETVFPEAVVDLELDKTLDQENPRVGDIIQFTLFVENKGPSTATGVEVTDQLPSGYAYRSHTEGQNYVPQTGIWTIGILEANQAVSLEIEVEVLPEGEYLNQAEITSVNEQDVDSENDNGNQGEDDQDSAGANPTPVIDLELDKSADNTNPNVGEEIVFTIVVLNNGPSKATGVQVSDELPSGYDYQGAQGDGNYDPGTGIWAIGEIESGDEKVLNITAVVLPSGNYLNFAEVTAANEEDVDSQTNNGADQDGDNQYDDDEGDEDDGDGTSIVPNPQVDLSLDKLVSVNDPRVGEEIVFSLILSNAGPNIATGIEVRDDLPSGFLYISDNGTGAYNNRTGLWVVEELPADASISLDITVLVLPEGNYVNRAEVVNVNEQDTDSNPNNGVDQDQDGEVDNDLDDEDDGDGVTVEPISNVDLQLNKSISLINPQVGEDLDFTIEVLNLGPSKATGIEVTDQLPSGYEYLGHSGIGNYDPISGIWEVGDLAVDQQATLVIQVQVLAEGDYLNVAEVTNVNEELNDAGSNDNNEAGANPSPLIDLDLNKSVDNSTPRVGETITFTLSLRNDGPSEATGIEILDRLPGGYRFLSSSGEGEYDPVTGIWGVGSLLSGGTAVLLIEVEVLLTGEYLNTAEVISANEPDADSQAGNGLDQDGDNDVTDDINDEDDGDGVVVEPRICEIRTRLVDVYCDDNNTPTEPADDLYYAEISIEGNNYGEIWIVDYEREGSSVSETGNYGDTITFGPFPIDVGLVDFHFIDAFYEYCSASLSVEAPAPCSNTCDLQASARNITCSDSGTPADPSDDTFSFSVVVSGANTGGGWLAGDGTVGDYDQEVLFGPFLIDNNNVSILFSDIEDPSCIFELLVLPPAPCSDLCLLEVEYSDPICNDDLTPSDPSDDTYTFSVTVIGTNTSGTWRTTGGLSGNYGDTETFGPYLIAEGLVDLVFFDSERDDCRESITINPPEPCSSECEISVEADEPVCDNNGTPADPSDDTYTVLITVTGENTTSGWVEEDGLYSGEYGVPVEFGPYPIADGLNVIGIEDAALGGECSDVVIVRPPESCSDDCGVQLTASAPNCQNAGTHSDPSDDTFTIDVYIEGANGTGGWVSNLGDSGSYGQTITFGPFLIQAGTVNLVIQDAGSAGCETELFLNPPETCSQECEISLVEVLTSCDDNGTPGDPRDDLFSSTIAVLGSNTGSSWSSIDGSSGEYGQSAVFGPFPIAEGSRNIVIFDAENESCRDQIMVLPPAPCSNDCSILATASNFRCDDSGTPSDPSDDVFTLELLVEGFNSSGDWVAGNFSGEFGVPQTIGPLPISESVLEIEVSDALKINCLTTIQVSPPPSCSNTCAIEVMLEDETCDNNGTPGEPADDLIYLNVMVLGANSGSSWTSSEGTQGPYGQVETFGPYSADSAPFTLEFTDAEHPRCSADLKVDDLTHCSLDCTLSLMTSEVTCSNNDTPSNPADDVFTFRTLVDGNNVGSGWRASNGSEGTYGEEYVFGPFLISDGAAEIVFVDIADLDCQARVSVEPPAPCSDLCELRVVEVDKVCSDNGTPAIPTDDTYTATLAIVNGGAPGQSWEASDGSRGNYLEPVTFGPYPISEGGRTMNFWDESDGNCQMTYELTPPNACSEDCGTLVIGLADPICDDLGTSGNPNDDTYTIEILVQGNPSRQGWRAPDGTIGAYNEPEVLGPYFVSEALDELLIVDLEDESCRHNLEFPPVRPCSEDCGLFAYVVGESCDDQGTATDPSDDTFTFYALVSGGSTETYWESDDGKTGDYNQIVEFGPYPANGENISITFNDFSNKDCFTSVSLESPSSCFDECYIEVEPLAIVCQDNGTPSDPADDTFTFQLTVKGRNTGEAWQTDLGQGGRYGDTISFGPYPVSIGPLQVVVFDEKEKFCAAETRILPPESCSNQCLLEAVIALMNCDDNYTPADPSDDTFSFIATLTGNNTGTGWKASDGTEGLYWEPVIFGPYPVEEGVVEISFSDNEDPACETKVLVNPQESCSDLCLLIPKVSEVNCRPSGSPANNTDDTFTFLLEVIGINGGETWTASDGTKGRIGVPKRMGPYQLSDGEVRITIFDDSDQTCAKEVVVEPPPPCSNDCNIGLEIIRQTCDDNGTRSDGADDRYTVDIMVFGNAVGSIWEASDGQQGTYGEVFTFGPFEIADGPVTLYFNDLDKGKCKRAFEIFPPETCSSECGLIAYPSGRICDNNGTPTYPNDDTFTFEVDVTGYGVGDQWQTSDGLITGEYGKKVNLGSHLIADGQLRIQLHDIEREGCAADLVVNPPINCSFEFCEIDFVEINKVVCLLDDTPQDPEDDEFVAEVTVYGNSANNPGAGWLTNDGFNGKYEERIQLGPYPIAGGIRQILMFDNQDSRCQYSFELNPPEPCSSAAECAIRAYTDNIQCQDGGTPADPADDTFTFDLVAAGEHDSGNWIADDSHGKSGTFGTTVSMGPYPISAGKVSFLIKDRQFTDCTARVEVDAPLHCSNVCSMSANVLSTDCSDGRTPESAADDTFSFELLVSTTGNGQRWTTAINGMLISGEYHTSKTIGPLPLQGDELKFDVIDQDNPDCKSAVRVSLPVACTEGCDLTAITTAPVCDDNGTAEDPDDDMFTIELSVFNTGTGTQWITNDELSSSGTYNAPVILGPYLIKDGNQDLRITDATDPSCATEVLIEAPYNCSGGCVMSATFTDVTCHDNGTPSEPGDDYYTGVLRVEGSNTSIGWTTLVQGEIRHGFYEQPMSIGPFLIKDGVVNLELIDLLDPECRVVVPTMLPEPCHIPVAAGLSASCPQPEQFDPDEGMMVFHVNSSECLADIELPLPDIESECPQGFLVLTEVYDAVDQLIESSTDNTVGLVEGLEPGYYYIRYKILDECGKELTQDCAFRVVGPDEVGQGQPLSWSISLDSTGDRTLAKEAFIPAVPGGCGLELLEVRRHYARSHLTCEEVTPFFSIWDQSIDFTCCEIGDTVQTELRVRDAEGSEKIIHFNIMVVDDIAPGLVPVPDIEINCQVLPGGFNPNDVQQLQEQFGMPVASDNCAFELREIAPEVVFQDQCEAVITRRFFAVDHAGNSSDTIIQTIVVSAAALSQTPIIKGHVMTPTEKMIEGVEVGLLGKGQATALTNDEGAYVFDQLSAYSPYSITPFLDGDYKNGVTTLDLIELNQYLLGKKEWHSNYKKIAADADNSQSVTTLDLLELRRLILGDLKRLRQNTSWRFIDRNFEFPDSTNPWLQPFPENREVTMHEEREMVVDFIGIKIGDLNESVVPNRIVPPVEERSNIGTGFFDIVLEDRVLEAGQNHRITFSSDQLGQILGCQLTLNFDHPGVEVLGVEYGIMQEENFGWNWFEEGRLTISWHEVENRKALEPSSASTLTLFELQVKALQNLPVRDLFRLESRYLDPEAYNVRKELLDVRFVYQSRNQVAVTPRKLILYQNKPNPFQGTTIVPFELPEAGQVEFSIYDHTGKRLKSESRSFAAGYQEVTIDCSDLPEGLLYFRLDTGRDSAVRKMSLIKGF